MNSKLYESILNCIKSGKLNQPFRVSDVNNCCKDILSKSPSFLSKHRVGNPGNHTEYFIRERNSSGLEIVGSYLIK